MINCILVQWIVPYRYYGSYNWEEIQQGEHEEEYVVAYKWKYQIYHDQDVQAE